MATERLNSHRRLAGLIDRLPILLDGLRSDGFEIGAGEYAAVHRLLLRLAETGRLPSEVRELRSFLGPLLCASAEEQRRFASRFSLWAGMADLRTEAGKGTEADAGFRKEMRRLRKWAPTFRWKRWLIGMGLVFAAAFAGWGLWPWISDLRLPASAVDPGGRISFARLIGFLLAFGVSAVVVRDLWQRLLVGRALRRGSAGEGGKLRNASMFAASEWPRLFSETALTETARAMRRPEPAGGWELDPAATVDRIARSGGRFSPVFSPRRRMPETLALVDRRAWRDHESAWAESLLNALAERDAPVSVFFFDRDPRICFSPAAGPRPISLDHLARRYPGARLLVFSDGADSMDAAPFLRSSWRNRAWFTIGDPANVAADRLEAAGFGVEPATEIGLWKATAAFNGESAAWNGRILGAEGPPETVVADSMAMRWREAPEPGDLESLATALRGLLDPDGWQWFCACAVYPEIRWGLTLHLGAVLTGADGAPLYNRRRLFALCRMPWFRHGAMPDWLRRRLMDEPTFRGKPEKRVRRLLFLLLKGVAPSGRLELEVAAPIDRFIPSLVRGMARRQAGDRALRDPVFMGFMTNSLAVRISRETARRIRRLLERSGKYGLEEGAEEPPPGHVIPIPVGKYGLELEFAWIPPGEFWMGSPEDEPGRDSDEKRHRVRLTKGFYMQTTPVTQGQWEAATGENPSEFKKAGPDAPVENVSWEDLREFIGKLNSRAESYRFRLPTEAEWEYACRAGTETAFHSGPITEPRGRDPNLDKVGWYSQNSGGTTHPVGQKEPNAWGLYDMHGNVWEWCSDWFDSEYYAKSPLEDPQGAESGANRVIRGGSWDFGAGRCRAAYRSSFTPDDRSVLLGFRLLAERESVRRSKQERRPNRFPGGARG
jgi:formylglycine-generating enzyme required for sulfatase activity/uncharacterized protein with von Willebrand factor type A (vWA) domain